MGVSVNALTMDMIHAAMDSAVRDNRRIVIANHNLHSVFLARRDSELGAFFDAADLVHIDGMPLVWIGKLLGHPIGRAHRTTYVDWVLPLFALAARRHWRVFYVGSKPGVAEQGARILRERIRGVRMEVAHGYFDATRESSENEALIERIRAFKPNVLMVGMSMPRQEKWIHENLHQLSANVILPCGAAIDYVAGVVPTPPRWASQLGLEWLFRLVAEPRRLARRYLIEPLFLLAPLAIDVVRGRTRLLRRSQHTKIKRAA